MFESNFTNRCLSTSLPWCVVYMHVNSSLAYILKRCFNAIHIFQIENLQRFLYCVHIHLFVRWFRSFDPLQTFVDTAVVVAAWFRSHYYFRFFFSLFIFHYSSFLFSKFSFSVFDRLDGLLLMRYFVDVQFVEYTFVFCSSSFSFISTLFFLFLKKTISRSA